MDWLDPSAESPAEAEARRGPPQLPGVPKIPPMPVSSSEGPAPPNKTIEVDPKWLELVEERRAKNKAARATPPIPRDEED